MSVGTHRVGGRYRLRDVLLHLPDGAVLVGDDLVKGFDCDFFQRIFLDGPACAVHCGAAWFKAADASPYDRPAAMVVPMDSPV